MARDEAYRAALRRIEGTMGTGAQELDLARMSLTELPDALWDMSQLRSLLLNDNWLTALPDGLRDLSQLQALDISGNELITLPDGLLELTRLRKLSAGGNRLSALPECISRLAQLQTLMLSGNRLVTLPDGIGRLYELVSLYLTDNQLIALPDGLGELTQLRDLLASGNRLSTLPDGLGDLSQLRRLTLEGNPLVPGLAAAYAEGLSALRSYLRAQSEAQIELNEAKLILIGEGEVGKSCLLGALRGDPFIAGAPSTHGIEIRPVQVTDRTGGKEITLNGWDFGGQRVYRPTHQLFFSAPAVYLVVWKPREGQQQGFVEEWIELVRRREPEAKILVVATHGGPGARQPDIDRQRFWDRYGRDTVIDFFHVDSNPDADGARRGISELREAMARVALALPGMGQPVPARWQKARIALRDNGAAYLSLERVLDICRGIRMDADEARLFVTLSHMLGHLIHYAHDPILRDVVILKPDWLATAISFVLDDERTRAEHGQVSFRRLGQLWRDPAREAEFRYPAELHRIFVRLMERFDLAYEITGSSQCALGAATYLIGQLVDDVRPELSNVWPIDPSDPDEQQAQVCRVVDRVTGESAPAEGLFYQLIVRLHRYSLGREDFSKSRHWKRGLVLEDEFKSRALLEHVGNDIRITVRAAYPERFLSALTYEVKWLVESFWEGLRCEVVVPCVAPCGKLRPGQGSFEVQKLISAKEQGQPRYPCPVSGCDAWPEVDRLLRNSPSERRTSLQQLQSEGFEELRLGLAEVLDRLDDLDRNGLRLLSRIEDAYSGLMLSLNDEAREGPRLFSLEPVDPGFFDRPNWVSEKFRLTLWCEHARLPLTEINGASDLSGVYELNIPREWFVRSAPALKLVSGLLGLIAPVVASATKLALDEMPYKRIEEQLDLGQRSLDSVLKAGSDIGTWLSDSDSLDLDRLSADDRSSSVRPGSIRGHGAILRQLHAWLEEQDPTFGGLVRVQNRRQEFLWVHPIYESEY